MVGNGYNRIVSQIYGNSTLKAYTRAILITQVIIILKTSITKLANQYAIFEAPETSC